MGQKRFSRQDELELKREEMIKAAMKYGFSSAEAVKRSQELDRLLNVNRMKECFSFHHRHISIQ
ncbi:aspartyl-phosphate phosphatase Spo0E family protein [Bacillus daqingensis]|uniref:Aspartyl-phosphate phosphatase Spo0E family protein n=1 Tax=Bacillus daqingensis TaxID=872396 RepID=A0ABV9P188_9BACI